MEMEHLEGPSGLSQTFAYDPTFTPHSESHLTQEKTEAQGSYIPKVTVNG